MIAVGSGIVQALVVSIAVLFSIQDLEELQNSTPAGAIAVLFVRATNNTSLTAFFLVILLVTQFGSFCNSFLAVAQLIWSMARDGCIPNHRYWYKLHGKHEAPLRILILVTIICIVVIMPVCHHWFMMLFLSLMLCIVIW